MDAADQHLKPYCVKPGDGKPLPGIGTVKATSNQTNGAFEVIELAGAAGPPPHVHRERDEAFYIVEGSFAFALGDDVVDASPGSFVFIPRGTRHGFTVTPGARALAFISPAGLEGFFQELSDGIRQGRSGAEMREALAGKYDSEPA